MELRFHKIARKAEFVFRVPRENVEKKITL